jgi:rare lipoprotein A
MSAVSVALLIGMGLMLIYDGYCLAAREDNSTRVFMQSGIASWYGREEQGKLTADGEHFDRNKFTAASRHLPFNTIVRVTNRTNGRSVQVRINDRGPFVRARVLDLSEAAADILDMKKTGTAPVQIEIVEPSSAEAAAP